VAVHRALESKSDVVLVAKSGVDGVYSADPKLDPSATKYDTITYTEAMAEGLRIMDQTAFALCGENKLPMVVFGMEPEGNILRVVQGERIGTLVSAG
jgi:uridylate kinase